MEYKQKNSRFGDRRPDRREPKFKGEPDENVVYGRNAVKELLAGGRDISAVAVDPSAASFIECIRRHGRFKVVHAKNDVTDGIRKVSEALKSEKIKICTPCRDIVREFSLYRWENNCVKDTPCKTNDHAMDDMRYFVTTLMSSGDCSFFAIATERKE